VEIVIPSEPPRRVCVLPERSGGGKGAPLFGAAQRTLAAEHRSGSRDSATGWRSGITIVILLVGSERVAVFAAFAAREERDSKGKETVGFRSLWPYREPLPVGSAARLVNRKSVIQALLPPRL
jgi:hypothetical protein